MALLNGTAGKQPAPSGNDDLVGDTNNETMNGEGAQDTGDDEEGEDSDPVLFTVLKNKDGVYTLVSGDEPDEADGLAAPEGAGPAKGGTPALPDGQQFEEIGPLLKAILDLLRGASPDGDGGQASFEDGFAANSKTKNQQPQQ